MESLPAVECRLGFDSIFNRMDISGFARTRTALLLDEFDLQMRRAARSADPDNVHDVRVAIRRFVQCLKVFADFFPAAQTKKIRRRLRTVLDLAGQVRDRDIAMKLLRRFAHGSARRMLEELSIQRNQARRELEQELREFRRREFCRKWKARLERSSAGQDDADGTQRPASDTVTAALPLLARDYFWAGRDLQAAATLSGEAFHQFRLTGKRLRYTLELFTSCYGPGLDRHLATLRKAQTMLGEANDCVAVKKLLDNRFRKAPGKLAVMKFLDQRASHRWAEFRAFWQREADADGEEESWIQLLESFPGFAARRLRRPASKPPERESASRGPRPATKAVDAVA